MKTPHLISLLALGTALASGAWLLTRPVQPPPAPAAAAAAGVASGVTRQYTAPSALTSRDWKEGQSFVYEVRTSREVNTGAKARHFDATIEGTLRLTVVAREGSSAELRGELQAPRASSATTDRAAVEALSQPFYFRSSTSGAFRDFAFQKGTPVEVVGLLKGLVMSFQFQRPNLPLPVWYLVEQDPTGEYEATYSRTAEGVHKTKTAYLRAHGAGSLVPLPGEYKVRSSIDFEQHASGWPGAVSEDESLEVTVNTFHVTSTNKLSARLLKVESQPELIGAVDRSKLDAEATSEAQGFARARQNAEKGLINGRNYRQMGEEFAATQVTRRNDAMVAMGALFRQDPKAVAEAQDAVLHQPMDAESVARTTAALGTAGTPEAQRALASILTSPGTTPSKGEQAAVALGLSKNQIPENEEVLKEAMKSDADNVANAAKLALGSTIRTRNAESQGDTKDALQLLVDGLQNATSVEQKRVYLLALGNTGDLKALDAIEPYLQSPEMDLRIAATTALRHMTGERADKGVLLALSDVEYMVRRAAVETIPFRPVTPVFLAMEKLLKSDPAESVRIALVQNLYKKIKEDPAVLEAIEWAATSDPSLKVQQTAKRFLQLET